MQWFILLRRYFESVLLLLSRYVFVSRHGFSGHLFAFTHVSCFVLKISVGL